MARWHDSFVSNIGCLAISEAALEHLLLEVREEAAVFGSPRKDGPPCIFDDILWVEGIEAVTFTTFCNAVDRFLTWGAAFTVFAQKTSKRSVASAAYIATVLALKTDVNKPPKGLKKIAKYLK